MLQTLEEIGENLLKCFSNNEMKLNTDKCHLLLNSQESHAQNRCFAHKLFSKWKTTRHNFWL